MSDQRISTDMASFDDDGLRNYGNDLGLRLTNNANYPKPDPDAATGLVLIQQFGEAISQARSGGAGAVARKNQLRKQVEALLLAWIAYATATTPADTVAWLTAGFRLTKATRDKVQPLPMPTMFTVDISGDAGTARLRQNSQETTRAYVFGYAEVPADGSAPVWTWQLCGKPDCLLTGLTSELPHLFAAGAWNGSQPWPALCAPVRRVVQ